MRRSALVLASLGLLIVSAAPASAVTPPRSVRLVSGGGLSDVASFGGISAGGSRTVFSTVESLLPTDTNATADLYARDANGTLQLVTSGVGVDTPVFRGISPDGDRTWYTTTHADVPTTDSDSNVDVYERRRSGALREISVGNGTFDAAFVAGSANGDHVLFTTDETNAGAGDVDAVRDIFDRRGDGSVRLVTPGTAIAVSPDATRNPLSADGTLASFSTTESLLPGDDGDVALDTYSVPTTGGAYTLLTPHTTGPTAAFVDRAGKVAWFVTDSSLVAGDADSSDDVYERAADGTIRLISGGTTNPLPATLVGALDDGSSVVFSTAEQLLPADGDAVGTDLYERRADDSLHLISGGTTDALTAEFIGENADGAVVFHTSESLLPADSDVADDIYLRRRDDTLVLLTPDTPGSLGVLFPGAAIPSTLPRTVFSATADLPGTGDVNGLTDAYEALSDGPHLLASDAPGGTNWTLGQAADGSRISFVSESTLGGGDADDAQDVYEANFPLPTFVGLPTLTGNGKIGSTQTCTGPTVIGEATTTSFSWLRDATTIKGATAATYKPGLADAGHFLRCRVTAKNPIGSASINSGPRGIPPRAATSKLAGFPIVGLKLTCTTFSGATSTRYAWKRGTRTVRGRKARTYTVGRSDLGRRITCTAVGRSGSLSATATLRISVPSRCTVPGVRGLTPAAAKTRLGNAGCRSSISRVSGSGVLKGLVLSTSPGRGAKRANGARITIRVRR
jgi:hypothetical protein